MVNKHLENVNTMTQLEASVPREKKTREKRFPFVSCFSDLSPKIGEIIKKHWGLLQNSYKTIPQFQFPPLMSYRNSSTLRDRLVKSEVAPSRPKKQVFLGRQRFGSFPCLHCINCRVMVKGETFVHPGSQIKVPLKHYLTCASDWIIYVLFCPCKLVYVGETTCDLRTRLNNHRYTIRKKRMDLPVSKHFSECGHNEWDLHCMAVDHVPPLKRGGDRHTLLLKKELEWIFNLKTLRPQGLNVEFKTNSRMWD